MKQSTNVFLILDKCSVKESWSCQQSYSPFIVIGVHYHDVPRHPCRREGWYLSSTLPSSFASNLCDLLLRKGEDDAEVHLQVGNADFSQAQLKQFPGHAVPTDGKVSRHSRDFETSRR